MPFIISGAARGLAALARQKETPEEALALVLEHERAGHEVTIQDPSGGLITKSDLECLCQRAKEAKNAPRA